MKFYKKLMSAIICLCASTSIMADDASYIMRITLTDGSVVNYVVNKHPKVSLSEKTVKVQTDEITAEYDVKSVVNYTFATHATGIDDVQDGSGLPGITFKYLDKETIIVSGLQTDDNITIHSLSGSKQAFDVSRDDNAAHISLSNLPCGTYIISVNNSKSIKVFKR
ncbi:MAG: T9SS type A sorting domain-containing protein [Bacteroidaceae bacterium]|nr:T9SS type A sorting domain-containing protein [Bacteroidaceae bacterium]